MPKKPKPIPLPPRLAESPNWYDSVVRSLLAVKKDELQKIEDKIKGVRKERKRPK